MAIPRGRVYDRDNVCLVVFGGQKLLSLVWSAVGIRSTGLLAGGGNASSGDFYRRSSIWPDPRSGQPSPICPSFGLSAGLGN